MNHKIHVYLPGGETTGNAIIRLSNGLDLCCIRNLKLLIEPSSHVDGQFNAFVKLHVDEATMPKAVTRDNIEEMLTEYAHHCMASTSAAEAGDGYGVEASDALAAEQKIKILDTLFPK